MGWGAGTTPNLPPFSSGLGTGRGGVEENKIQANMKKELKKKKENLKLK